MPKPVIWTVDDDPDVLRAVERDLRRQMSVPGNAFLVECSPAVCEALIGPDGENVEELEHALRRGLFIRSNPTMRQEEYEIIDGTIEDLERKVMGYRRAQVVECNVRESVITPMKAVGWTDTGYYIELVDGEQHIGKRVKVCLEDIRRSFAAGSVILTGSAR